MAEACSIRVVARFRPMNEREKTEGSNDPRFKLNFLSEQAVEVQYHGTSGDKPLIFSLDHVFDPTATQEQVYENAASRTIQDVCDGFNGTIFAFGQTGAGKTFTMSGPDVNNPHPDTIGIVPRANLHIFDHILKDEKGTEYIIKCSYLEIYNEEIHDLLSGSNQSLKVRESPRQGVWVEGLQQISVGDAGDIADMLCLGNQNRAVSSTDMNATSSRSHSLFIMELEQKLTDGSTKIGKLNLVDLAGSEKVGKTGATGQTLNEAKNINKSLSALGNVIKALTDSNSSHIPYRDSKLTRILQDSLGGNTKTTLVVACSPHPFNVEETISTLRFAQRAKSIKNTVKVNLQRSAAELEKLVLSLQAEIRQLKAQISGGVPAIAAATSPTSPPTEISGATTQDLTDTTTATGGDNSTPVCSPRAAAEAAAMSALSGLEDRLVDGGLLQHSSMNDIDCLKMELEAAQDDCAAAESRARIAEERAAEAEAKLGNLLETLEAVESEITASTEKIQALSKAKDEAQAEAARVRRDFERCQREAASTEQQLKTLQESQHFTEQELKKAQDSVYQLAAQLSEDSFGFTCKSCMAPISPRDSVDGSRPSIGGEDDTADDERQRLTSDRRRRSSINASEQIQATYAAQLQRLKDQLEEEKAVNAKAQSDLETLVEGLHKELDDMSLKTQSSQEKNESLQKQLNDSNGLNMQLKIMLGEAKQQLEALGGGLVRRTGNIPVVLKGGGGRLPEARRDPVNSTVLEDIRRAKMMEFIDSNPDGKSKFFQAWSKGGRLVDRVFGRTKKDPALP